MRIAALLAAITLAAAGIAVAVVLLTRPTHPSGPKLDVPILMYHRIGSLPPNPPDMLARLTVQPRVFAAQMTWLARHGFHAITPQQLYDALERKQPLPSRPVLITFDDGYRDVLFNAEPVLHRLGMPATAFVITGRISGPDPSFFTWQQLRDLERDGFTVGSHTVDHAKLTDLSAARVIAELKQSRSALEQNLGHAVPWFAYPYGATNDAVTAQVGRAGYRLAFTTQRGSAQYRRAPLLLERYEIARSDGLAGFVTLLHSRK
jgi:peptidoglycan/xylan/chitin deacetylase (PgdA/CDA1 family)